MAQRTPEEQLNYSFHGRSVEELREEMNRFVRQLSAEMARMKGVGGTPRFFSDIETEGHRIKNLGMPSQGSDAQRFDLCLTHNGVGHWDAKGFNIEHLADAREAHQAVNLGQMEALGARNELVFASADDIAPVKVLAESGTTGDVPRGDHAHQGSALLAMVGTDAAVTGTVAETTLYVATVPAGALGATHMIRIWIGLVVAGGGGAKTIRFKVGATTVKTLTITPPDLDPRWIEWYLMPSGSDAAQRSYFLSLTGGAGVLIEAVNYDDVAESSAGGLNIAVTAQLANAGDSAGGRGAFLEFVA